MFLKQLFKIKKKNKTPDIQIFAITYDYNLLFE